MRDIEANSKISLKSTRNEKIVARLQVCTLMVGNFLIIHFTSLNIEYHIPIITKNILKSNPPIHKTGSKERNEAN